MEALYRFIELCQRKSAVVLEDSVYSDFNEITLADLVFVPMLFILSFLTSVYFLLGTSDGQPPFDESLESDSPLPIINGGGDLNPLEEEPWQYREDYPSPY
ncbi:unnamed protein product [Larinioides sclopetarius]|uniref:Uncharacterized protein n=1 Tax=Larinioides sclopetarius TaxID=280406 RepID=A0AAV2A3C1_9ARAC